MLLSIHIHTDMCMAAGAKLHLSRLLGSLSAGGNSSDGPQHSPRRAVDPEAPNRHLRVLQVDAIGEQRLDILIVLWLEFGS